MTTLRRLDELSCKQLKEELRARELMIFCDKEKMRVRLRQNLVDEGEDAETYLFEDGETMIATLSREKLGQLAKEKAAPAESSVDYFVGNTLLPSVAPTVRPPPALTNVHYPVGHLNLFGTNRATKGTML
ncbi:E3 ubiquitin-protein ligase makorin-1 [Biomphalaria pfeifferi]|uniref:E3 ubiquitin-protein ligase makorin-1 n=1 Tax=Biomphalaria pfeifferi TaxID=112525 RepID=A0AAD8C9H0_BIOPF|nr:E3 ubiquitin-protein ligase makorin-1 [Biomphalaria pfeifferi]